MPPHQDDEAGRTDAAEDEAAVNAEEEALRRILRIVGGAFPGGAVGFLVLLIGARDTPTTGAAALMLVFAVGFPLATFALTLEPARTVWKPPRDRQLTWLAALASLPVALLGALTALVLFAAIGLVI